MRIGIFTDQYYPIISGVVVSIKMLYEGLEKMGHKCYIFTSLDLEGHEDDPEIKSKDIINFDGVHYPFPAARDYKFTFRTKKCVKVIEKYNLDIIHIQSEFSIANIARAASKKLNIPIVHTLHTAWINYICTLFPKTDKIIHPFWVWVMKTLFTKPTYKASTIEILPTKKMIPDLKDYGIVGDDFEVMPTGIELDRFLKKTINQDDLDKLKKKLGIENKFVYIFVGRTAPEKNIELLIKGFAKAFKDNNDVRFLIVGGGPSLEGLKVLANELEVSDKVVFTGLVDWKLIPVYYHLGDVFLNASNSETQGLTYIEALASGLPNIVKKDLCIDGVVIDGENGFIFETEDEFVEKIKYIFNHLELLQGLKDNAIESSLRFSKEEFSKQALSIYEKAIIKYQEDNKKIAKRRKK